MATNERPPAVVGAPGYLLYKAGVHAQHAFDEALEVVGLTARQFLVLSFASHQALSQQAMSARLGLDPTIVVGLVDDLEARQVLVRGRDPTDRRRYLLAVTADGARLLRRAEVAVAAAERQFLDPLDDAQQRELGSLLQRLMAPKLPWMHGG